MKFLLSGRIDARAVPRGVRTAGGFERLPNLIVFAVCFCLLAGALVLAPPDPVGRSVSLCGRHVPGLCTFNNLTGLPCPGCGLVRSITALVHGDVAGSLAYHRLGWLVLAYVIMQLLYRLACLVTPVKRAAAERIGGFLRSGLVALAVLLALNWILMLAGYAGAAAWIGS